MAFYVRSTKHATETTIASTNRHEQANSKDETYLSCMACGQLQANTTYCDAINNQQTRSEEEQP